MEALNRTLKRCLYLIVLVLLLGTVAAGTSENINAQLLKLGISIWDNYFILRGEEPKPQCDPGADLDTQLDKIEQAFFANKTHELELFPEEFDREATRISISKQLKVCQSKHHAAQLYHEQSTPWVKAFASTEIAFAQISLFSIKQQKVMLLVLLMLCASYATLRNEHIAFRGIRHSLEHTVSHSAQALAAGSLAYSSYRFYQDALNAGATLNSPELLLILLVGSCLLAMMSILQLYKRPTFASTDTSIVRILLTIPIQTWMLLAASYHFIISDNHAPGISMYFTQIFQLTNLHLAIGLYIWVGMLLKETLLGARLFDVFKPWNFPPEILACIAIALMAVPTAYTGASGIIIIAMGAVVYQELRRVGTRRQLALAVTAMTGSSGVVLRPCLLVVGVAILNKEVLSDDLFLWGSRVFMLTLLVFFIYAMLTRREPLHITPATEALKPSLSKLRGLLPYVLIILTGMAAYAFLLDAYLDEFSAPIILPVIMMACIIYERCFSKSFKQQQQSLNISPTVGSAFSKAIGNSSVQIGALLMLMACSFTIGGILERNGSGLSIPEAFDSIYLTMGVLVLFLIFVGMIMDPFGALILVSGLVAPLAYEHGVNPIHFWMTALVAFELGYLSPPVSLNHLLTRQVVGSKEFDLALTEGDSFYYRHERLLLPLLVMATTLIIVAFVPLSFY